jgi:hypothetical protein
MPRPAAWSRRAHRGGAKRTPPSATTGRPAKSDGSRMDAITTSHGHSMAWARSRTAELLPVPGPPQSSTGTCAATASPSASRAVR